MNKTVAVSIAAALTALLVCPSFAQNSGQSRKAKSTYVPATSAVRGAVSRHLWSPGEWSTPTGMPARTVRVYQGEDICQPCTQPEMNCLPAVSAVKPPSKAAKPKVTRKPPAKRSKVVAAKRKAPPVVTKNNTRFLVAKIDDNVYIKKSAAKPRAVPRKKAPPIDNCDRLLQEAQLYIHRGDIEGADRLLKNALHADPNSNCLRKMVVNLSMYRARHSIAVNNLECAARRLRDVLYLQPENQEAQKLLNSVYAASGVNPLNGGQRTSLAQSLAASGRDVAALVEYREAARLTNSAGAYIGLSNAAIKTNQNDLALASLKKAAALDPGNSRTWQQIGFLEEARGQQANAAKAFLESARLNPSDPISVEKSLQLSQQLAASMPGSMDRKLDVARAYLASNQSDKAAALYNQINQLQPRSPSFQDWVSVEQKNSSLKQALVRHASGGTYMASDSALNFLTDGPQPSDILPVDAASAVLQSSCHCN